MSSSGSRAVNRVAARDRVPHSTVDLELVTDDVLQVVFYIDLRPDRVHDAATTVVYAVDRVASWLDFYKYLGFRHFDLAFRGMRSMLEAQKDKDRKRPPR